MSAKRAPFSPESVVIGTSTRMREVFDFVNVIAGGDSSVLITGESGTGKELDRQPDSPCEPAPAPAVRGGELRHPGRDADRIGAVRSRAGRVHQCDQGPPGPLRARRRRHAVSRRHRRCAAGDAGETAASLADAYGRARRQRARHSHRCSGADRQQARATQAGRGGHVPGGSVLPAERDSDSPAAAARARRGHPALRRSFPESVLRARKRQPPKPLSPAMLDAFTRYPWPGNVRELENVCERIAQTCICDAVVAGCVPAGILFHSSPRRAAGDAGCPPRVRSTSGSIRWSRR